MRTNTAKTASQTLKAHPSRFLRPAFGACQNHGRGSLTPATTVALCFPARLANRCAESTFAVSAGAGQSVPVPPTWLEGKREAKARAAFPTDSPEFPVDRGCNVKPFER